METVSTPGGPPPALLLVMRLSGVFRSEFVAAMEQAEWARQIDCGPPMFGVLRATAQLGAPSQRDIATTIGLDPSDLVGVLDRMERNGWVTRERDPEDRRRSLVRITDDGRAYLDRYNDIARRVGDRLMAGLDDAEREEFERLAAKVLGSAGDDPSRLRHAHARL